MLNSKVPLFLVMFIFQTFHYENYIKNYSFVHKPSQIAIFYKFNVV